MNSDWFFLSHRLPIALEASRLGFEITIVASDTGKKAEIESHGFKFINLPLLRSGINPIAELKTFFFLKDLYTKLNPDIVHHVALKAVIYGTLAVSANSGISIVNAISGLGFTFIENNKVPFLKFILLKLLKLVLKNPNSILIFQNPDDIHYLKNKKVLSGTEKIEIIKGSGIDLDVFNYNPEPETGPIIISLHSRMLWDKGINEYIEAAKILKRKYGESIRFLLIGGIDSNNRSAIPERKLLQWKNNGDVEWLDHRTDIKELLQNSHISVLPSYREGLPKSLIESCACGKPIVTTDVPGCREVVQNSVNGFLVKPYKINELAAAIDKLISSKSLRVNMGLLSRKKAEQEFSIEHVVEKTIAIYYKSLKSISSKL